MTEPAALIEDSDLWVLPHRGMQIDQIEVSYQLILMFDGGGKITVEAPVLLRHGSVAGPDARPIELVPERREVAAVLAFFGGRVLSSVAFKSGSLCVVFDSGLHLKVTPDLKYEAWGVTGPGRSTAGVYAGRRTGCLEVTGSLAMAGPNEETSCS